MKKKHTSGWILSPISNKTANARISDIFQTPKNSKIEKKIKEGN